MSQVATTRYVLDGGEVQDGSTVAVTGEGIHTLEFWSVDIAGNEEAHDTATIRIDQTVPGIAHTQTPPPNGNGWNNTPVTVSFSVRRRAVADRDLLGRDHAQRRRRGSDGHGSRVGQRRQHRRPTLATVNIDQVEPTISAARDRVPNGNGWYDDDVTVSFSCTRRALGVASCSRPADGR